VSSAQVGRESISGALCSALGQWSSPDFRVSTSSSDGDQVCRTYQQGLLKGRAVALARFGDLLSNDLGGDSVQRKVIGKKMSLTIKTGGSQTSRQGRGMYNYGVE